MNFEKTKVMNFQNAFRGLRNPLESWKKSDSAFGIMTLNKDDYKDYEIAALYCQKNGINVLEGDHYDIEEDRYAAWLRENGIQLFDGGAGLEYSYIGPNDLDLAKRMIAAGSSDRKFLRQIFVSVDITAPIYWQVSFCQ